MLLEAHIGTLGLPRIPCGLRHPSMMQGPPHFRSCSCEPRHPRRYTNKNGGAAERCRGRLLNSASQEAWADWRAAYDSLPPTKVAILPQRAEQSKHIARANRERVKAQRCAQDAAAGGTDATTTTESSPSSVAPVAAVGWPSSTVALRHFADRDDLNVMSTDSLSRPRCGKMAPSLWPSRWLPTMGRSRTRVSPSRPGAPLHAQQATTPFPIT